MSALIDGRAVTPAVRVVDGAAPAWSTSVGEEGSLVIPSIIIDADPNTSLKDFCGGCCDSGPREE